MVMYHGKKRLRRPCKVCEELFFPNGRFQKVCDSCYAKHFDVGNRARLRCKNI